MELLRAGMTAELDAVNLCEQWAALHIQWKKNTTLKGIELIADGNSCRKFLKPSEEPEGFLKKMVKK